MGKYFEKFPIVNYANQIARNITARTQFTKTTIANQTIFYPYAMKEQDTRLDIVSHKYYKNADYTWMIMMTNQAIDPYFDLGIPSDQFDKVLEAKYGSLENAQRQIAFWRNDWASDDSLISVSTYNAFGAGLKKYWNAVLDYDGNVIGYERKKEDWIVTTNMIVSFSGDGSELEVGDWYPYIPTTPPPGHPPDNGEGFVTFANSSVITVQHVTNTYPISSTVTQVIPVDEVHYWSPVSCYTAETEANQDKRNIKLLDNRLTQQVEKEVERLLNG